MPFTGNPTSMSTGVIILIVIAAVVVLGVAALALRTRGAQGSRGLKRRFGPEYERAVARHDGDSKAAEHELAQLVERHGGLKKRALDPADAERFATRWTAAQEHFVDAPREAVTEAERLLAEVAAARGFPAGDRYEEQLEALAVHHAPHVQGYRHLHHVARNGSDTEEMRAALLEGRGLFEELVGGSRRTPERTHAGRS